MDPAIQAVFGFLVLLGLTAVAMWLNSEIGRGASI